MTPRQVRAALRRHFNAIGFVEEGSSFVCQTPQVTHAVEVNAVRRLPDTIQIHHRVASHATTALALTEEISSHGHNSPYPRIWSASSIDPTLVLEQVGAIYRSFQTRDDLAHFFSDRGHPEHGLIPPDAPVAIGLNSMSAAESSQALGRLAHELLGGDFSLVPRRADFELWASKQDIEGFRHCAYVDANQSSTLAVVVTFALPAPLIAGGLRTDAAVRMLMTTPKKVLFGHGRPILLPLSASQVSDLTEARAALAVHLADHPPHRLAR